MPTIDLTFDTMNRDDYDIEESENYVSDFEVKVFNEPRPYYATAQHNHDDKYAKISHTHTSTDIKVGEVEFEADGSSSSINAETLYEHLKVIYSYLMNIMMTSFTKASAINTIYPVGSVFPQKEQVRAVSVPCR